MMNDECKAMNTSAINQHSQRSPPSNLRVAAKGRPPSAFRLPPFIPFIVPLLLTLFSAACLAEEPAKPADQSPPAKRKPINWSLLEHSGNYTRTKVFGLEAQGTKFVYVFDRSGSMGEDHGKPLKAAKAELLASLADLDEHNQFYIIFYNQEPRLFDGGPAKGQLVFATPENKQAATDFVNSITADGNTNHTSALMAAICLRPDVIFLLTDGEEKDDLTAADLDRIDRLNGGGASINVIQFAPTPRPGSSLVELAKSNRGQNVFIDPAKLPVRAAAKTP
jgi:von Willebrand factor type A domain